MAAGGGRSPFRLNLGAWASVPVHTKCLDGGPLLAASRWRSRIDRQRSPRNTSRTGMRLSTANFARREWIGQPAEDPFSASIRLCHWPTLGSFAD